MSAQLIITLCVILFIIIGFFSGKFGLGLVAMTASAILCLTGVLTFEETFAYFSNSTVVIVFCMLVLGASLQKTHFTVNLQKKLLKKLRLLALNGLTHTAVALLTELLQISLLLH